MKILYGVLAFIVLVVVAAFVVPSFIDWNSYKPEITERIEALTGRQLSIDGDIDIALLPSPKLRISDARLSNLEGAKSADMARLQALDLRLALGPLISGDIQVSSLTLIDPVIEMERLADGRTNWLFTPLPGDAAAAGATGGDGDTPGDAGGEDATAISLDSVSIQNGTIIYRDSTADTVEYFQRLNGSLSAKSLDGPFRGDGSLEVRGLETSFQIASGRKRDDGHMPVSLKIELGEDLAQLGFEGKIFVRDAGSDGSGTLRASGPDLAALAAAMGVDGAQSLASDNFSLKAETVLSETGLTLDDLQIRLGETQANGAIAYLTGAPDRLDAEIKINRFDLDKITENGAAARGTEETNQIATGETGAAGSESSEGRADGGAQDAARETAIDVYLAMLPTDLAASIDLEVQTLRYLDGVVQQAHAVLSLDEGVITIQQATALLPGGSNVALFGQISPSESGARFDGQVDMASDDVRAFISWLDLLNASDLPADRLRRFSLTAGLSADATGGELSALDLRIDASRLQGYANFALGTPNVLDANLHLDNLNADAYLTATANAGQGDAAPDGGTETATESASGGAEAAAPSVTSGGSALAVLDTLNATLKMTVGRLSYGGAILSGVTLESVLSDKILTVQRLEISDLSGAKLAINGEIRDPAGEPDVTLNFDAKADSILGLIRVAGITPNFSTDNLGAVSLSGVLSGGRDSVNLNARLDTRPAKLSLIGSIATPLDNAVLNFGLELRAPDTAELLRAADMTPPKLAHRLGALALDGGLDGSLEALNMSLSARAAGNHLQVAGNLADFSTGGQGEQGGRYDLVFDLDNPSFATLAELLSGAAYEGEDAGEVRIKGRLAGDANSAAISDLSLAIGKTHIAGAAEIMLGGPVPVLHANLQAGLLDAGLFVGSSSAGGDQANAAESSGGATATSDSNSAAQSTAPAAQRQAGQWSREPFDLSPLAEIEADISVQAEAILAGGYRFDQAELKLRVAGGALEIDSLRGRLFDGLLEAEGRVADAQPPQASLAFKLDGIDMAQALREAAQTEAVTGRASVNGRLTSAGYSEYDLVRALQGDATLRAGNGTVEGVDLRVLSDRLGELNDPTDFLGLADSGLSGGTTRLDSLDGTVQIRDGLATTNDLVVLADGGRGDIRGTADLPSWQLDLIALFDLTDHPKAPPVGVRMTGAIDNPARELLISEMQAYLIKRIAKTSIGKLVVPKLRKGAKAEPGSIEDTLLRGIFGDPDDDAPAPAQPPTEQSAPALAPQTDGSEATSLAPQKNGAEPPGLAPQQGESHTERAPAPAPAPAPERAKDDPLSPTDILKGVFDIIGD
ncbi:MAG: AsmA family protein [Proteobacteria bacterium]|nr:AsmA family protein [Pseudomonadota bacterium]MDA1355120.1 AsmA family protein [Pseudomonadota bacterium]